MNRCPFCNSLISKNDETCPNCKESLKCQCPNCKEIISVNDETCPFCTSKLKKNNLNFITKLNYLFIFLSAFMPHWIAGSMNNHPAFWMEMMSEKDSLSAFIKLFTYSFIIASLPAFIAIYNNYRKRLFVLSIITIALLCACNICLVAKF